MFEFEQAVAGWKSEMAQGGVVSDAEAAELESHLRESAGRLMAAGLSEEEAFLLAVRRLGGTEGLKLEYGKEHPERVWRERAAWMFAGLLVSGALGSLSSIAGQMGLIGAMAAGARGRVLGGAAILTGVGALGVEVVLAVTMYRRVSRGQLGGRPVMWIVGGVTAIVLGRLAGSFWWLVGSKFVVPADVVQVAYADIWMMPIRAILMPVLFGVLAIRLQRKSVLVGC